ncbi:MAG TPA: NAD-dependent epimerase/dehydratase family protein [Vicinamibacterales bacterium]|nr:NAD-dependent epimerase/dehydratase family protein [Vicinamibacterales bacterium]
MRVFVAGGSGTIGLPLVRALVAAGHHVTALTRSPGKQGELRGLGASVAVADALDRDALMAAVAAARPTHVIHQLTALPKDGVRRAKDLEATNRLRIEGTKNLLDAAIAAGAGRFVVGSFAILSDRGADMTGPVADAFDATRSMERQVLEATTRGAIEGVVLRYGLFYGSEAPSTMAMIEQVRKRRAPVVRDDTSLLPVIQLDDAVSATVLALERAPGASVYDIVDDRAVSMTEIVETIAEYTGSSAPFRVPAWLPKLVAPYIARITSVRLRLSNAQAKAELAWRLRYPTMRDGLAAILQRAA